ncbi:MAG: sulfurtransferase [Kordia sp.]|nr:MAG: sulfurtransferase [Kordia sp.]
MVETLVSSDWLMGNISDPDLIILDASQKENKAGFKTNLDTIQIANARKFDIKNNFSDTSSCYTNTLLSPEAFEIECKNLGINKTSKLVVYDNLGVYSSPRVWWMFKVMGFDNISVLDGGLPDWVVQGGATESCRKHQFLKGSFATDFQEGQVRDFEFIKKNLKSQRALVIDARSADRFNGLIPESRKGLRRGNIPNSINIPFQDVLENGKFKSKKELLTLFNSFEVKNISLVFSCGSGLTACIVLLASELVLENKKAIYDGSWTEWAQLVS